MWGLAIKERGCNNVSLGQYLSILELQQSTNKQQLRSTGFLDWKIGATGILIMGQIMWILTTDCSFKFKFWKYRRRFQLILKCFPQNASDKKCWIWPKFVSGEMIDDWGYWNVYLLDNLCIRSKAASSPGQSNLAKKIFFCHNKIVLVQHLLRYGALLLCYWLAQSDQRLVS